MATIANLLVRLAADFGDAPQKVRDLREGVDDLGHSAEEAGGHVDALGKHASESGEGFGNLSEALGEFGKELLAVGLEAVEITSVFEVLKESLEVSAEIESVTVALTQFAGSVEKAGEMVEQLESIARSEALKFPEVLPAAQHFMALGFSSEQTARSIEVAGNASWALGTSLESVTQRMGMMAMGGQVSGRFLRSLGISVEDLGRVMGITGKDAADLEDKVRRAFKFETEEERLQALQLAMDKFAGLGAKEADTLSGKWLEMKNAFHEAFATLGDDMSGAASVVVGAVTGIVEALKGLLDQLDIVGHTKTTVGVQPTRYIDDKGKSNKTLTASDLASGAQRAVPGTTGIVSADVTAQQKANSSGLQSDADAAASSKRALAESDAAQEYARRKTEIDANAAHAKSLIELWRSAYAVLAQTHQATYAEQLAMDRQFNQDELSITLGAIAQKKSLQTSTKGLKEEDKDATLDAQSSAARDKFRQSDAALEAKEIERQAKFVEGVVKIGEQRAIKEHELQDKMRSQLEAFAFENADLWKKIIADERKDLDEKAALDEKQSGTASARTASYDLSSVKTSQLELERGYGLEFTHNLQQQVAYQKQLGDLEAQSLGIKAQQAARDAQASMDKAMELQTSADIQDTDEARKKAADALDKANRDALKVVEAQAAVEDARYQTATKILDLKKQENLLGGLKSKFNDAGAALPGELGGAISSGIFHQGKGGVDVGKQITDSLRNVGKSLLGDTITAAIKELVIKTGLQTAAQSLLTAVFGTQAPTQITATTANTAAVTSLGVAIAANTAAVTASATASGAGAAVGAGGAAAGAVTSVASTAATGAVSSIIGPVIGGVISGVISAAATLIGDAGIIKAINRTTAAVYSLRPTSGTASPGAGSPGGQAPAAPAVPSSFIENIGASLMDAFTASDAIPVKIMAINPGIVFASVASLFGFASGGPVPHDMVAKVHGGEHVLNADQVAGLAPLPDLPAFRQFTGVTRDQGTSISSQSSNTGGVSFSGPMNFHGVQNVRQLMREISEVAKNASPGHSPLGR